MKAAWLPIGLTLLLSGCQAFTHVSDSSISVDEDYHRVTKLIPVGNDWYKAGAENIARKAVTTRAKNVILFVGDGMSLPTIAAARIFAGQQQGKPGEEHRLSFENFPYTGLSKTYNTDAQTPDSAGTMTAMMSGVKTRMGIIGQTDSTERGVCDESATSLVPTALELAEIAGLATGVVTTTRLTHATPSATYAHASERNWEDSSDMPAAATAQGCLDIAQQLTGFRSLLNTRYGVNVDGPEIMLGGGWRNFLPEYGSALGKGDRNDGRDLLNEWQQQFPNGQLLTTAAELAAFDPEKDLENDRDNDSPVMGVFARSHLPFQHELTATDSGVPDLVIMTEKAIRKLQQNSDGFLLIVEAGRIDHAHHVGNAYNALLETVALSDAVERAVELTDVDETLILVTADHGHVMTFAGYPKRGNPILGKVINPGKETPALALDGKPYTTLSYANGMGQAVREGDDPEARYEMPVNAGRQDITNIDTESHSYHQEALVPLYAETHSGEDVAIYASGPWASLVSGVHEQNDIFHIINQALDLTKRASAKLPSSE